MKKEFDVDGYHYVVSYVDNSFEFYIDVGKSPKRLFELYNKNSNDFCFGDDPPTHVFKGVNSKNIFKIKNEVISFIDQILDSVNPYYFCFSANEDYKMSVYYMVAKRIAESHGYYMDVENNMFSFYRRS